MHYVKKHLIFFAITLAAFSFSTFGFALSLERIASGFDAPLYVTSPPNDDTRIFLLEKNSGQVRIIRLSDGEVLNQPFLTVTGISTAGEQGLLSMAFPPDYASSGVFYISATNSDGNSELRRYRVTDDGNLANPNSSEVLLTIPQFASNHNGGWIGFGPDGFLYMSSGDGGGGNDPQNNGQDLTTLLGTILRIDVNGDDFPNDLTRNYRIPASNPFVDVTIDGEAARGEIWSYGLRNPWRPSFDRQTGDFFIADVGQSAREEINFQVAGNNGGENYGWRLREGDIETPSVGGNRPEDNVEAIYTYGRDGDINFTGQSVTGGYRYRGDVLDAQGLYFFGDFVSSRIWSLRPTGENGFSDLVFQSPLLSTDQGAVNNIASFGEDARGNLYIVDFDGDIFKLVGETEQTNIAPIINLILNND